MGLEDGISYEQQNFAINTHNIEKQVLDYPTRGFYLLGCGLSDLELLGYALACHVAQPPRRRRQTSLQISRRILDERDIGQSRAAKPRPQLEPLLKRLLVIFIRCVFDDNSAVPFTDFAVLFGLALPLLWDFDKSRS
jgi:hypothetical protein